MKSKNSFDDFSPKHTPCATLSVFFLYHQKKVLRNSLFYFYGFFFSEFRPTLETIPIPLSRVLEAGQRYITLHRCLFGTYEGELMPRPSPEIRRKVE